MTRLILLTSNIIVPSNFWRDYIIKKYDLPSSKIITTYEAVDPKFLYSKTKIEKVPKDYLLYTGNLYPHKNIKIIFKALKELPDIKLKIICARSTFTQKITKQISSLKLQNQVEFLGYVPDSEFSKIYSEALALVHPSFLEGFSLTGLEAMSLNCPVIAANSSCLPEIYQNSVLYFDPYQANTLITQITKLKKSPTLRQKLIERGHKQVLKYSWNKCAQETILFYQKIIN